MHRFRRIVLMTKRMSMVLVLALMATGVSSLAQQQPLPPPGSLTTPPTAPNPLIPPQLAPPAAATPIPTNPIVPPADTQQPPGTLPQTQEQSKTPEISGPTEIVLEAKPVILLRGQSTWDDGFDNLIEAFAKLNAEAKKLNFVSVGQPQAAFMSTDDFGFKYEAMVVLNSEPTSPPANLGKDFVLGKSPSGKALKFTHAGAYDDIDTTYEAITAYLDEKGLKARNIFIEEYMNDPKSSEDTTLEMNIFVLIE
jgi:effector-binding domain-containing protein